MAERQPGAAGSSLTELVDVIGRLRRECAWKASQTHESLTRYLLEESHELVEAIDSGDPERIRDELGDVLLQVYLHAAIAEEAGAFDIDDVAAGLHDKMLRRNPHVFGGPEDRETDPERINERWQQIKAGERDHAANGTTERTADLPADVMAGVPEALPALLRADKLLDRLQRAGQDAAVDAGSDDLGERLLALVAEAHVAGIDPEQALRAAVRRRQHDG